MESLLILLIVFMIMGALFAIHAKDLLAAVISTGFVGFTLVLCFFLLRAPDLAMVQIIVETITLIIMVAVVLDSTQHDVTKNIEYEDLNKANFKLNKLLFFSLFGLVAGTLLGVFEWATRSLEKFGDHSLRMAHAYLDRFEDTGSANLVTGILFDFRGYDTLGEATVLFTAVLGVITIIRLKGRT